MMYFDYAAATPMDPEVLEVMRPYFTEMFFNPSATYLAAVGVRKDLEAARSRIAHYIGARPVEIIFTAGGTEANNLAIRGIMEQYPDGTVVTSRIEHDSVLHPARAYSCREVGVDAQGIVQLDELAAAIDDNTVLVSVMYANNEVGTLQPIRQIAQKLAEIKAARKKTGNPRPLYFHTDAAQAAQYLDLHASRLGVDLMTVNAGKIYGPKQCGMLYAAAHVRLKPQVLGGGQERGVRSGTENVAGVIGFAKALELVQERRTEESRRLHELQQYFYRLISVELSDAVINGSQKHRLPNNVHITLPGHDNERLLMALDNAGILCAAGSACSASNEEASHVLMAMGVSEDDARASLRFTMGCQTTRDEITKVVATLKTLVN